MAPTGPTARAPRQPQKPTLPSPCPSTHMWPECGPARPPAMAVPSPALPQLPLELLSAHLPLHPWREAVVPLAQLPHLGGGPVAGGLLFLPLGPGPSAGEGLGGAVPAPMLPMCGWGTESQRHAATLPRAA